MALTTTQLRSAWAPPCRGPWAKITLHGGASFGVRPAIVEAVKALNACFVRWDYKATPPDCGAYNCRQITGGSGYSLHAYSIALDINWQDNPYGKRLITDMPMPMIEAIERIRTRNGKTVWRWGGRYRNNKDAMHFEIVCRPSDLATGIGWETTPKDPVEEPIAKVMRIGHSGNGVGFVQAMLNIINESYKLGDGQPLAVNEKNPYYGPRTAVRVKEFQAWVNNFARFVGKKAYLSEDGVVGPETQKAIAEWVPVALEEQNKKRAIQFEEGSRGNGVAFLQDMLNIINGRFPLGDRQPLAVTRKDPYYGPRTAARVSEFQVFVNNFAKMVGEPARLITNGKTDGYTLDAISAWVAAALEEP